MNALVRAGREAVKGTIGRGFATAAFPDRKVTVLGAAGVIGAWAGNLPLPLTGGWGSRHAWGPGAKPLPRGLGTCSSAVHSVGNM